MILVDIRRLYGKICGLGRRHKNVIMVKISVVVPVYNCSQYLKQCVRSVLGQTLKELEVICVDDGSTDASPVILKQLQAEDARIRIFTQENMGAGPARNKGLEHAEGRYVAFMDADDYYLDRDALETMYYMCEERHVRVCGSLRKRVCGGVEEEDIVFPCEKIQPPMGILCQYRDYQSDYNYQSFLFARELLTENHIFFPAYRRFQDPPFFVRAMYAAKEFCMADKYLYCYRAPLMAGRFDSGKAEDLLKGLIDVLEFADRHDLNYLFRNTLRRLNYDYECIIYRNITRHGFGIIELLVRANQLARSKLADRDYVLRPLGRLLADVEADVYRYETRLHEKIVHADRIFVYGAGRLSELFLAYLEKEGLKDRVGGIVVSRPDGNPGEVSGIKVKMSDNLRLEVNEMIFVAARVHFQEEIVGELEKRNLRNYELLDGEFLDKLERENKPETDDCGSRA